MVKACRLSFLALAAFSSLSACHEASPAADPQGDRQAELRREQDCADPQWKAANLGLWYNLCPGEPH
jgi:hypothetical protein